MHQEWGLRYGWVLGLYSGLLICIMSGGLAAWRYAILRLLQRAGVFSAHCVRFFDEATGNVLRQKVGGGYRFIHRLLLDYFAYGR
ncbi:MAG: hypothetical protein E6J34_07695 [Chloroflexi bacterium]|nr:MAG: hypothetical protein E6J34_07695 [Chloroflexota bacterium]